MPSAASDLCTVDCCSNCRCINSCTLSATLTHVADKLRVLTYLQLLHFVRAMHRSLDAEEHADSSAKDAKPLAKDANTAGWWRLG